MPLCPGTFNNTLARLTLQLETLLNPLWSLSPDRSQTYLAMRPAIIQILTKAMILSRYLHASRNAVYTFTTSFKDETFDPARQECYNLEAMMRNSPYDRDTSRGYTVAVLRAGMEDRSEAITQITCFPGLVKYEKGGGDLAAQRLADEHHADEERMTRLPADVQAHHRRTHVAGRFSEPTVNSGFRTRTICKSVVYLQWSRKRLLTEEAGTSVHIDAMAGRNGRTMERYEKDCAKYVELDDLFQRRAK